MTRRQTSHNIRVVVFDLDGTLTESKLPLDAEMAKLLMRLLEKKIVAIVGGGKLDLFVKQILKKLPKKSEYFKNLFLFPTNGTAFYRYIRSWKAVYKHNIPLKGKKHIQEALTKALNIVGYKKPARTYGKLTEDRGSQITFSGAGQNAPLAVKEQWNKTLNIKRLAAVSFLKSTLPDFEVRAGGLTSIDITPKGIDKAYAIHQIQKVLRVTKKEMIFIGDAIYPGGNDYAAVGTGVRYVKVSGPYEVKRVIRELLG